jgi:hypothetical protein
LAPCGARSAQYSANQSAYQPAKQPASQPCSHQPASQVSFVYIFYVLVNKLLAACKLKPWQTIQPAKEPANQ